MYIYMKLIVTTNQKKKNKKTKKQKNPLYIQKKEKRTWKEKKGRKEQRGTLNTSEKDEQNGNKYIPINNHFKYK